MTLSTRIEADLRVLEKLRIKPVFVFPGLQPKKSWKQQNHNMEQREACGDRASAWSKYEAGYEDPLEPPQNVILRARRKVLRLEMDHYKQTM